MTSPWTVMLACSAVAIAVRGAGPALAGTSQLSPRWARVVTLLAPALLAGLLATSLFSVRDEVTVGASGIGVGVAAVLVWRRAPLLVVVFSAAVVTAVLRRLGVP